MTKNAKKWRDTVTAKPITASPEYKRKRDEKRGGKKISIYMQEVILEFSGRTVLHFKQIDLKVLGLFGS